MFGLIKKMFMGLLIRIVNGPNHTKFFNVSVKNVMYVKKLYLESFYM